jgi:hypothetical protein
MKRTATVLKELVQRLNCFGEFDVEDLVCKKMCGLRLRCAVDSEEKSRMEVLDDLFHADETLQRPH